MKKNIFIFFIAIILIAVTWLAYMAWQMWSGIKPVVTEPPADIADLIDQANKSKTNDELQPVNSTGLPLELAPGFSISVFARDLGPARVIVNHPGGGLLVSITKAGQIVALPDTDNDGQADKTVVVLSQLYNPHGLVLKCADESSCELYIAETSQVSVYDYSPQDYTATNRRKLFDLPDDGGHFTRTLLWATINNENKLLTSVGSSCNVCEEEDWRRAAILISDFNGENLEVFAGGLRNSVFMATHPVTGDIWATDMGRDNLGDNLPPEEINIINAGNDYGWPICYGDNQHDTDFDKKQYVRDPCTDKSPAQIEMQAHSAPLGIAFIPEEGPPENGEASWPEEYWYNAIVAYHGSWNRSEPTGYKIVRMKLDEAGNFLGEEDFITGWLTADNEALGRPVAILIQPGGIMYISDDKAGVIYRVIYQGVKEDSAGISAENIRLDEPLANKRIASPLIISGEARGTWFFEGDFPVLLRDTNGEIIAQGIAQTQDDWMTEDFVPFKLELVFALPPTEFGELVLRKDNPSGLPEMDDAVSLPIVFKSFAWDGECEADSDCDLPGEYAARSSCPFQARCLDGQCAIVCPDF